MASSRNTSARDTSPPSQRRRGARAAAGTRKPWGASTPPYTARAGGPKYADTASKKGSLEYSPLCPPPMSLSGTEIFTPEPSGGRLLGSHTEPTCFQTPLPTGAVHSLLYASVACSVTAQTHVVLPQQRGWGGADHGKQF